MIELADLTKRFGTVTAVDAVSLRIDTGAMVGVIGPSGAGKSTLLRLINRLADPDDGAVRADGVDVGALRGRRLRLWRANCAMIFQQFQLIDRLDVITNVLVGTLSRRSFAAAMIKFFPRADRARAILELDRLGMAEIALQRAGTLSGGQMQRVAIARAMMQEPAVLLADEPVSSLDPHNAEQVMRALDGVNRERGITVLVNLHSLDLARKYCSRIIGMNAGRVVFDGPAAQLDAAAEEEIYGAALSAPAPVATPPATKAAPTAAPQPPRRPDVGPEAVPAS